MVNGKVSKAASGRSKKAAPSRSKTADRRRGRSGGLAGGAGYDFQDIYVALQLAKMLMGDIDPPIEVIWEKKGLDEGDGAGPRPVYVDDAILRLRSGRCIFVQVKESAPAGGWTAANVVRSGLALQLWRQWSGRQPQERAQVILRVATGGDVRPLAMLVDVALRCRTLGELYGDDGTGETEKDVRTLANGLPAPPGGDELLSFLKALQCEQLHGASETEGLIIRSLSPFGAEAPDLARRLLRLVARSKHAGPSGGTALTRETLITALRDDGLAVEALIAAGVVKSGRVHDAAFWDAYRAEVVKKFKSFRVYGLHVDRAVFADLPSLFVPLKLAAVPRLAKGAREDEREGEEPEDRQRARRRSLADAVLPRESRDADESPRDPSPGQVELAAVLRDHRRIGLIGGPGSGKTTTLRWLAIIAALPGDEGRGTRVRFGLPPGPLLPLFVSFRRLAERVRARGLDGVGGRAGLVSEFLGAEFEAGFAGRVPGKLEALQTAEELLGSEQCLFLFDALDEVADEAMRLRLFEAVGDLMERYPAPRVVVSSRPYAFRQERAPLDLALFRPLPLDRGGRGEFARQWYRSVRTHLGDALDEAEAEVRAEDLGKAAEAVADLAENPLLLSILALVHFNRQGLPVERCTLYDHATLAMLGHWDRDAAGHDLGEDAIPADWAPRLRLRETQIRRVVESLAHALQGQEAEGDFPEQSAVLALEDGLGGAAGGARGGAEPVGERARLLLRLLVERSGLLQERSPGLFSFVHLSFLDYLAARWFVGAGEKGLAELAELSANERYAEVIRFAVGILAADERLEADSRVRSLIAELSRRDPVLAATCLLEAPGVQPAEAAIADLARRVWAECSEMRRHHYEPRVTSRLVWSLLVRTGAADDLLLEFLALESGEGRKREMMGIEVALSVLAARPAGPMPGRLAWVLGRLAATQGESWLPTGRLASLLLIESGRARSKEHLPALVRLLGDSRERWSAPGRGGLDDRAEELIEALLKGSDSSRVRHEVCAEAVRALDSENDDFALGAARLLLKLGWRSDASPAMVLVEQGLGYAYRHAQVAAWLLDLARDPQVREAIVAALTKGLRSDDADVRKGSARVLKQMNVETTVLSLLTDEERDEEDRAAELRHRLGDPATRAETLSTLAEALWEEDIAAAWRATRLLCEAGHVDAPGLPQALVKLGLGAPERRAAAIQYLRILRNDPRAELAVRAALLEGLQSADGKVATASALLMLDSGDGEGRGRVERMMSACLRDPAQWPEVLPRLRTLMQGPWAKSVLKVCGATFERDKFEPKIAAFCGKLLAEAGHLGAPNLAKALVVGGLAEASDHDEVLAYLKRMLDDRQRVTAARKALAEGLASADAVVAWGAARCLWETGSRTDPGLAAALVRAGLTQAGRREQARTWLRELLAHPRTAARALQAMAQAIGEALDPYNKAVPGELAWEIGCWLVVAQTSDVEHLAPALVQGLAQRERHEQVLAILRPLLEVDGMLADELRTELWKALGSSDEAVSWGAARTLLEVDSAPTRRLLQVDTECRKPLLVPVDQDERRKREKTGAAALIRILLRESEREPKAAALLTSLVEDGESRERTREALLEIVDEGDPIKEPYKDEPIVYSAARLLFSIGELEHRGLPAALVNYGLGHYGRREEASRLLDGLGTQPSTAPVVTEALHEALWGASEARALHAALYLLDRGERSNRGVARALVFGGLRWEPMGNQAERSLLNLLADPLGRAPALDALRAGLLGKYRSHLEVVARLLVLAGEPLHERLLRELAASGHGPEWPVGPLAALALTGRVDEAREGARRLGIEELTALLGEEPFPAAELTLSPPA